MKRILIIIIIVGVALFLIIGYFARSSKKDNADASGASVEEVELLHVSFDIAREIGKRLNAGFIPWYKEKTGIQVKIEQSNAGSSKQARAVADGLQADIVSMNQYLDIDLIYELTKNNPDGAVIPQNWQSAYPNNSSPASSTMAFVVRKGNPKNIRDWDDVIREGIEIIAPNYRSTGNGRYSLLTAYTYGKNKYAEKNEQSAVDFVQKLIQNTPILATGGRDATNIFVERGIGDVLLTFEAEVNLIVKDLGPESFEIVVPSYGVDAKIYVVVIDAYAKDKGEENYKAAKSFWDFIYTDQGQEIVAQSFFRPINDDIAKKYQTALPDIELFNVEDEYGSWDTVKQLLFDENGVVAKAYELSGKN